MRLVVFIALAATAVAASGAEAAPAASCSRAAANAAIRQARPHITSLANTSMLVTPAMTDEVICFDFTRDGRTELAVTIASGGTAGDIGFAVLRATPTGGWRVGLARSGYKLGLFRLGDDVVSSQPIYRKNDPNCCPTGGFDHRRFHWNGARFVVAKRWHTTRYRP